MGVSVGATGFALGAARAHGDGDLTASCIAARTWRACPSASAATTKFAAGGTLGNALLLAMLTANRVPDAANGGDGPGAGR